MSWQNNSNNNKNPWGGRGDDRPRNPWGGNGGPYGGGPDGPDFEEVMRRIREGLDGLLPGNANGFKLVLLGLVLLAGLWLASGFYIVQPGESGVVQRFGDWERTKTEEGLGYHLPWPIETVATVNVSELRRMEIGFTQMGQSAKRDVPEESLMLTSDANIVNLDLVVLWNISSAEDYIFNIEDPENTIKKVAESAIREVVGQTPMFPIITQARTQVAQRAREIMMANLDQYKAGVNISQVLIQEAEVHPDVQDAFQDVQSAKQDAIDVQNRAQAYREDILPRARGEAIQLLQEAQAYRQSTVAQATGDADRFNSVYEAYLTGKDVTRERLYIETMEQVLGNANKIIMEGDSGVLPYLPLNELRRVAPAAGAPAASPATTNSR
ncbi:MAG: FtsH protease activity modulator HflK [Alphaproteobacteria bacterium]|nr:FtsH protease activity modulator HflK [Alphaproteobacteria bacterium]